MGNFDSRRILLTSSNDVSSSNAATTLLRAAIQSAPMAILKRIKPITAEEEREFMIRSTSNSNHQDEKVECVLCLESFDVKPRASGVLCGCGINKHAFHLDCLKAWRRAETALRCPMCEHELFFDEFFGGVGAGGSMISSTKTSSVASFGDGSAASLVQEMTHVVVT